MRFRRSRRRNLILLSSRVIPSPSVQRVGRLVRRQRLRFVRTGALLTIIGVMRLAQTARARWRISLGLAGVLLQVLGHFVFSGQARVPTCLLGLAVVLVALLKSTDRVQGHGAVTVPQTAWRWHG